MALVLYPLFTVSSDSDISHADNEFLKAALNLGMPGLIAFSVPYLGAFWMLSQIWQSSASVRPPIPIAAFDALPMGVPAQFTRALVLAFAGGLFAHIVYGMTDAVALGAKPGVLFGMLLGLIAGLFGLSHSNKLDDLGLVIGSNLLFEQTARLVGVLD